MSRTPDSNAHSGSEPTAAAKGTQAEPTGAAGKGLLAAHKWLLRYVGLSLIIHAVIVLGPSVPMLLLQSQTAEAPQETVVPVGTKKAKPSSEGTVTGPNEPVAAPAKTDPTRPTGREEDYWKRMGTGGAAKPSEIPRSPLEVEELGTSRPPTNRK